MRIFIKFFLCLILVLGLADLVKADPVRIILGEIRISRVTPTTTATNVNISSGSTTVQVNREGNYTVSPIGTITPAGTNLPATFNLLEFTSLGGTGGLASGRIIDGGNFNDIVIQSTQFNPSNSLALSFSQPVTVPYFSGNVFSVTIPFTMTANFQASCANSLSCQSIDGRNYAFAGSGNAELSFTRDSNGNIVYESARYTFSTPEPTPEPATLLLLGTGLAGVIGYAKRKGRGKSTV